MTARTYYAMTAERQLAEAQVMLDTHVTSSADGRCVECGVPGPCPGREVAVVVFSRTLRLPRRQPGATRPDAIFAGAASRPRPVLVGAAAGDGTGDAAGIDPTVLPPVDWFVPAAEPE
jgi:hypothetical protein